MDGIVRRDLGTGSAVDFYSFAISSLLYGIYTIIFAMSAHILLYKRSSSMRLVLLSITLIMYTVCTVYWACISIVTWEKLSSASSSRRVRGFVFVAVNDLFIINVFLSDAVVIWRAWLIWNRKTSVLILPGILLLTSLTFGLMHVVLGHLSWDSIPSGLRIVRSGCDPLFCLLATGTNICSTLLIAWKTWKHRQDVRRYLTRGTMRTQVEKVLIFLIESGSIYSVITGLCGISFWISAPLNYFINSLLIYISGLYPTLIIVFAAVGVTHYEQSVAEATPMAFVTPSSSTMADSSSSVEIVVAAGSASDASKANCIIEHAKLEDRGSAV